MIKEADFLTVGESAFTRLAGNMSFEICFVVNAGSTCDEWNFPSMMDCIVALPRLTSTMALDVRCLMTDGYSTRGVD